MGKLDSAKAPERTKGDTSRPTTDVYSTEEFTSIEKPTPPPEVKPAAPRKVAPVVEPVKPVVEPPKP